MERNQKNAQVVHNAFGAGATRKSPSQGGVVIVAGRNGLDRGLK